MSDLFGDDNMPAIAALHKLRAIAHMLNHLIHQRQPDDPLSAARMRLLTRLAAESTIGQGTDLSPSEISESLGVSRNTISALLNGLEEDGLIERHLDPTDRRRFRIRITASGQEVVEVRAPEFATFVNDLFASLSPEEQAALLALLEKLFCNLLAKAAEMRIRY